MPSSHPLMEQLVIFFASVEEEFGEDYIKVEVSMNNAPGDRPKISVWVTPLKEFVVGADPDDVLEEAKRRLIFTRRQNAIGLPSPKPTPTVAEVVEPAPASTDPDDDIPF